MGQGANDPRLLLRHTRDRVFWFTPYNKVKEFLWKGDTFPSGRKDHPVVLVTYDDAVSYCSWKGE